MRKPDLWSEPFSFRSYFLPSGLEMFVSYLSTKCTWRDLQGWLRSTPIVPSKCWSRLWTRQHSSKHTRSEYSESALIPLPWTILQFAFSWAGKPEPAASKQQRGDLSTLLSGIALPSVFFNHQSSAFELWAVIWCEIILWIKVCCRYFYAEMLPRRLLSATLRSSPPFHVHTV